MKRTYYWQDILYLSGSTVEITRFRLYYNVANITKRFFTAAKYTVLSPCLHIDWPALRFSIFVQQTKAPNVNRSLKLYDLCHACMSR